MCSPPSIVVVWMFKRLSHTCVYLFVVVRNIFISNLVVILMKMTMTGAMCVISPGTPGNSRTIVDCHLYHVDLHACRVENRALRKQN